LPTLEKRTIATATKTPWIVGGFGEIAAIFGVSRDTVRKDWVSRGMPGGSGRYDLRKIILWREKDRAKKTPGRDDGGDPFLDGDDSPNLERYRGYKADLAALELQKKRKEVIDLSLAHEGLGCIAEIIRQAGETLQVKFGVEARDILDAALVRSGEEIETRFGVTDGSDDDETSDA
jgi:phage terminase Nu1 subunit (DNA packaging protein)